MMYVLRGYRSWWERLKVAWRVLRYGEPFPQPQPWYESLYALTEGGLSRCCKRAVEKVEREYQHDKTTRALRLKEAQQWARAYALEDHVYQAGMREGTFNFLIEWWVAKLGGKF